MLESTVQQYEQYEWTTTEVSRYDQTCLMTRDRRRYSISPGRWDGNSRV